MPHQDKSPVIRSTPDGSKAAFTAVTKARKSLNDTASPAETANQLTTRRVARVPVMGQEAITPSRSRRNSKKRGSAGKEHTQCLLFLPLTGHWEKVNYVNREVLQSERAGAAKSSLSSLERWGSWFKEV